MFQQVEKSTGDYTHIPDDIWGVILEFLPKEEWVKHTKVCKGAYKAFQDKMLGQCSRKVIWEISNTLGIKHGRHMRLLQEQPLGPEKLCQLTSMMANEFVAQVNARGSGGWHWMRTTLKNACTKQWGIKRANTLIKKLDEFYISQQDRSVSNQPDIVTQNPIAGRQSQPPWGVVTNGDRRLMRQRANKRACKVCLGVSAIPSVALTLLVFLFLVVKDRKSSDLLFILVMIVIFLLVFGSAAVFCICVHGILGPSLNGGAMDPDFINDTIFGRIDSVTIMQPRNNKLKKFLQQLLFQLWDSKKLVTKS